jgi:hypothetical protein
VSVPRYWTLEEARAALPRVRELLESLQRAAAIATRVRSNGHAVMSTGESTSGTGSADGDRSTPEIQTVLDDLEKSGIVLRDPARGLVDFPSMHLGRIVHLCWQLGEDDLDWWHLPEDGFAGRRRLPLPAQW